MPSSNSIPDSYSHKNQGNPPAEDTSNYWHFPQSIRPWILQLHVIYVHDKGFIKYTKVDREKKFNLHFKLPGITFYDVNCFGS